MFYQRANFVIEGQFASSECENIRTELESLREYPAKVRQLEQENVSLRSKLERAANRRPHTPKERDGTKPANVTSPSEGVDRHTSEGSRQSLVKAVSLVQEDDQIRSLLEEKERAYASLMEKHLKMTRKFRQLKESTKSWQAYHEKSVAKSAQVKTMGKDNGGTTTDELLHGIITPDPSCPAPSGPVASLNGPRNTTGNSFNSSSGANFHFAALLSSRDAPSGAGPHGHTANLVPDQIESLYDDDHREDPSKEQREPPSESSEPSSTQSVSTPVTTADQLPQQNMTPCLGKADGDSDSPVVVSERTLKRKRAENPPGKDFMIYGDAPEAVGSLGRPIQVKSEQGSSPITPANTRSLELVHDSLDLDEVGARNFTPRKIKRTYATGPIDISGAPPGTPREDRSSSFIRPEKPKSVAHSSNAETHDEEYYAQLVQRLGPKFWEAQPQKEARHQEEQERLDAQVPEHLRGTENSKMARQYLHNQKAHARQMRAPEIQRRPEGSVQSDRVRDGIIGIKDETKSTSSPKAAKAVRTPAHDILRPMTPNVQVLPRISGIRSEFKKRKLRRQQSGSAAVPILAEDGEGNPQDTARAQETIQRKNQPAIDGTRRSPTADQVHRRLGGLLHGPTPETPPLSTNGEPSMAVTPRTSIKKSSRNTEVSSATRDTTAQNLHIACKTANTPSGNVRHDILRPRASTPAPRASHIIEARSSALPNKERLRDRPVHQLHSDDFKINSAANHGLDFAYSEVVRKRDQRKCLPNCTKPECCGDKFNRMVKIGGFGLHQHHSLWDSSPVGEQEANYRLINAHFGLNAKQIDELQEEERSHLLDKAKADRLAREYGKHRHAHERQASPPGFWRTEMPTTQELEADREIAKEEERKKVEGRYREAIREGGRWMFRDE
ncbi:Peroxisomal membrane protein pex16 [Trapelia coarctata]|nr:Peroxisomal membrane protein pex16 [Trapelia coarctata]